MFDGFGFGFRISICFAELYGHPCVTSLFGISHGFNVLMSGVRLIVALVQLHVVVRVPANPICIFLIWIGRVAVFHDCVCVRLPIACATSTFL